MNSFSKILKISIDMEPLILFILYILNSSPGQPYSSETRFGTVYSPLTADTAVFSPTSFSRFMNFAMCSGTYRPPISTRFKWLSRKAGTYFLHFVLWTFNRCPIRGPGWDNTDPSLCSQLIVLHVRSIIRGPTVSDL